MPAKKQAATQKIIGFSKEELFAHAFIKHAGNGTAAAREVFNLKNDNSAAVKASRLLRNDKVCKIIDDIHQAQRVNFQKFVEQGPYYLTMIAQRLLEIIQDKKIPIDDVMKACETLARFSNVELSEAVTIARIKAEAVRSVPEERLQPQARNENRKVLFMLSPPPMPPGGTPPPALEAQWREMRGKPDGE